MALAAHLEYQLRCAHTGCMRIALPDSNYCAECRPQVFELGIGAADAAPTFAPLSVRLDEQPAIQLGLTLLEALGYMGIACMLGAAAGGVAVILQRVAA